MDTNELATAVYSITPGKSIFDPVDLPPITPHQTDIAPSSPCFEPSTKDESSDEDTRHFILKNDGFVPKSESSTPRVKLRKTPRLKNAPTCDHSFKKGPKKGQTCGNYCRIGEAVCARHKKTIKQVHQVTEKLSPGCNFDLTPLAVKTNFKRLKTSKKYKLLKHMEPNVILECKGHIIKVRLPMTLMPIPKTGSYLKFEKASNGSRPMAVWEC